MPDSETESKEEKNQHKHYIRLRKKLWKLSLNTTDQSDSLPKAEMM